MRLSTLYTRPLPLPMPWTSALPPAPAASRAWSGAVWRAVCGGSRNQYAQPVLLPLSTVPVTCRCERAGPEPRQTCPLACCHADYVSHVLAHRPAAQVCWGQASSKWRDELVRASCNGQGQSMAPLQPSLAVPLLFWMLLSSSCPLVFASALIRSLFVQQWLDAQ